jgi:hypothetical protein
MSTDAAESNAPLEVAEPSDRTERDVGRAGCPVLPCVPYTAINADRLGQDGLAGPSDTDVDRSRQLAAALVVISTAQLMVVLDATIVAVALPSIQGALHFRQQTSSGSSLRTPSPSEGCCSLVAASATCSVDGACSCSESLCFLWPRWSAASPRLLAG